MNYAILKACDVKFFLFICFSFPRVIQDCPVPRRGVDLYREVRLIDLSCQGPIEDHVSAVQIDLSEDLPLYVYSPCLIPLGQKRKYSEPGN